MKRILTIGIMAAGILAARAQAKDIITYEAQAIYPEGTAYNPKTGEFLVSSMHTGKIGSVTKDGQYSVFVDDDALVSSAGILVDAARNRLLVCVPDVGVSVKSLDSTKGQMARLVIFDLDSKKRLNVIDLGKLVPGGHFANDVAVDAQGNAYVTDSFSPVIYKVDVNGQASVFVRNDVFKGEGFNLNGIVVHPQGYLLVSKYNAGDIYKISLSDPSRITKVEMKMKETFSGADGLILQDPENLIVVQNNGANRVVKLRSKDRWKTAAVAKVVTANYVMPTTGVMVGKKIYVNNSHLSELFDPKSTQDRAQYSIEGTGL